MLKVFLSSHGKFASGIKSSVDILFGKSPNLTVFDAYVDQKSLDDELDKFYLSVKKEDEILLLSDMYGGSVNQIMFKYINKPHTALVTGVNLPFVIEVLMTENMSSEKLNQIIDQSRENLKRVVDQNVEEEDFFKEEVN